MQEDVGDDKEKWAGGGSGCPRQRDGDVQQVEEGRCSEFRDWPVTQHCGISVGGRWRQNAVRGVKH